MRRLTPLALACLALSACGSDRQPLPSSDPNPAKETRTVQDRKTRISFKLPRNYSVERMKAPFMVRARHADTFVSLIAYKRKEQLPRDREELAAARRRLTKAAQGRDRSFRLERATGTRIGGHRAVELLGTQFLSGTRLRFRSMHIYARGYEYVIEVAAPRDEFKLVDDVTTPLIKRTLKVARATRG